MSEDRNSRKVLPWHKEDMIMIGQYFFYYNIEGSDCMVYFFGGKKELLSSLINRGVNVRFPRRFRDDKRI